MDLLERHTLQPDIRVISSVPRANKSEVGLVRFDMGDLEMNRNMVEKRPVNPPRRTAIVWCFITAASVLGIFNTTLFGIDGFDGGFALASVSILFFIMGIIIMAIYFRRAAVLDEMLQGTNLIAHWTYSENEWRAYAEREHREQVEVNRGMFLMIALIALIVGVIFVIVEPDALVPTIIAIGGIIVIIGFTSLSVTLYRQSQNRKFIGEVYLNLNGAYINRELHTWTSLGCKLESALIDDKFLGQTILVFKYSAPSRTGRDYFSARIPVPLGKETEAEQVLAQIKKAHLGNQHYI